MKKFYTFLILVFTVVVGNAQIVNIPDANFKAKLLAASSTAFIALDINFTKIKIDTNNDGEISVAEAQVVRRLFVSNSNISNLTGIGSFTNLLQLNCSYNQLTALDVNSITGLLLLDCQNNSFLSSLSITNCNALTTLNCDHNVLSALDVSANVNLTDLSCNYNQLTNLNINNCFALTNLQCSNNLLTSLNVTNRTQLTSLGCSTNQLTTLDLSGLTSLLNLGCILNQISNLNVNSLTTLTSLECGGNQLTALNVSNLVNLDYLNCHSNFIQALDVSNLTHLSTLICKNNNLNYLNLKNGYNYTLSVNEYMYTYCIDQNPLSYICADDNKIQSLQDYFGPASTININSYCSFNPGGTFYTIQGNHRWDVSGNGCDSSDFMFPNMKLTINSASNAVTLVSGANGSYHFNVPAGTYTLTPIVENPSYFVVSPASVSVTFPSTTSLFTQDFCISANGIRNDLEVSIIPLGPARPGFVAYYKIIYKNKGNNAQTGTVNLVFEDAKMDLFSASPTTTIASFNNLSWSFSNLLPFETREILFTMDINSPMETPAVNIGDVLHFTATVVGLTDQTPNDNTAVLNQVTINGLDPNDKTCSEGTTVSPSTVGQYVHYVIRFENTGTANAQNIVVKDMIDTAK